MSSKKALNITKVVFNVINKPHLEIEKSDNLF